MDKIISQNPDLYLKWFIFFILIVTTAEIARFCNFRKIIGKYFDSIKSVGSVIVSKEIVDEEKEGLVLAQSRRLFKISIKFAIMFLVVSMPFALALIADALSRFGFLEFVLQKQQLFFAIVIGFVYSKSRHHIYDNRSEYSLISKFLHKIFLANDFMPKITFELEKTLYLKKSLPFNSQKHLFITGLARSGTTILLNLLYRTNYFASLTYNDMPLVLSPNLWNRFNKRAKKQYKNKTKERAHKDRIKINIHSPEALDEVFWRTFTGKLYLKEKTLTPYSLNATILDEYDSYISLILNKYQKKHYLTKNNNTILRLDGIIKKYPRSFFVILFRDPIQQANSLLKQHLNFRDLQKEDPFALSYMNYLAHHEFGLNHKPFELSILPKELLKNEIEYWLHVWIGYYRLLLNSYKNKKEQIVFVSYEKLCNSPNRYINEISRKLSIDLSGIETEILKPSEKKSIKIQDEELKDCAYCIYQELKERTV